MTGIAGTDGWTTDVRAAAAAARAASLDLLGPDHRGILEAIRRHLPRDGVVVRDSTIPAYVWGDTLLPILAPRTSQRPVSSAIGTTLRLRPAGAPARLVFSGVASRSVRPNGRDPVLGVDLTLEA